MGVARRVVIPGWPHHVTLKGARSTDIFASDSDRHAYVVLLREAAWQYGLAIWAWCLMTNHVHIVAVPCAEESLGKGIGESHRRYSRRFNAMQRQSGHLFKARFFSYPVEQDASLLCVVRYVELNPVMAGLAYAPGEYAWSSAKHHIYGAPDPLIRESPLHGMVPDWSAFLADGVAYGKERKEIERHMANGSPLGSSEWIGGLEAQTGRVLVRRKPGRKPGPAAQPPKSI